MNYTYNDYEIIHDENQGISIKNKHTGAVYDLLEGMSYRGKCSSDIVFIMVTDPEKGYTGLLNFSFGAYFIEGLIQSVLDYIIEYEEGREDAIAFIGE